MDIEKDGQTKVISLDEKRQKEERLKKLQRLIDAGEYSLSAQQIAESLLRKEPLGPLTECKDLDSPQDEKNSKKGK